MLECLPTFAPGVEEHVDVINLVPKLLQVTVLALEGDLKDKLPFTDQGARRELEANGDLAAGHFDYTGFAGII